MKLNKKGFGVAEMAIVILLIGILAAAVIVGFIGIKNKANSHVQSEVDKSKDIINATKHAYPIILSDDQNGLSIGAGEYEVYDLNGKTVYNNTSSSGNALINNGGQLFVNGSGGVIKAYTPVKITSGTTEISNVKLKCTNVGTTKNDRGSYGLSITKDAIVTLNNVTFESFRSGINITYGSEVVINQKDETFVLKLNNPYTSRYCAYVASLEPYGTAKLTINGGKYISTDNCGFLCADYDALITVNYGSFVYETAGSSYNLDQGVQVDHGGMVVINDGYFELSTGNRKDDTLPVFVSTTYAGGTLIIRGGEFVNAPRTFANSDKITVIITGGTFRYHPDTYNWRKYVDETVYDIDDSVAGVWKVVPKTN